LNIVSSPIKAVIVTGPTASGKTELLDDLFGRGAFSFFASLNSAARGKIVLPSSAEVLSADSMQAYKGLDIGTAKPSRGILSRLPHHLIDFKKPNEQYTAGEFVRLADALCAALGSRNVLPVISGGTGFYIRNFLCGPASAPPSAPGLREKVSKDLAEFGVERLRRELESADPVSAGRIGERDIYRLTRAIEILRTSGLPPSSFAPPEKARGAYDFLVVGVERPRGELKELIGARVDAMFAAGLPEEVATLAAAGYDSASPGLKAIGYREFFEMKGAPLSVIAEAIKLHTRQYAKRQMTFLRALPGIVWIKPDSSVLAGLVGDFLIEA